MSAKYPNQKNDGEPLPSAQRRQASQGLQAWLMQYGLGVIIAIASLSPVSGHAAKGYPMPECAEKLFQCAGDAAKTVGQSVLTVGNILGHVVANAECVAAMASGSPVTIGVTGLVVGLGAAGVVSPTNCEAGVYGPAIIPVGAGLDAVLGTSLSSQLKGATLDAAQTLISPIPVPAVPPTVGGLINCGCGALEAGAQALEDVRKVAKFAAATYESCGAAANSCPGLKQALVVLKGVYQVITDPSSIVQSCDSMSRRQYLDARLRYLIPQTTTQFRQNIAWDRSPVEKQWEFELDKCNGYYDSHCYKEDDAKAFCAKAVFEENLDPEVWASIIEEFNGPQFDKYFAKNASKDVPMAACPSEAGAAINIGDPNAVTQDGLTYAARSANAKACRAEMDALVNDGKDGQKGFYSLAHDLLPTTREGWNEMRLAIYQKPMTNSDKIFRRAMTAAAVVIKAKMTTVSEKYMAADASIRSNAQFSAIPYEVLNSKYSAWAGFATIYMNKCPPDPKGWAGKYDTQCVQEFLRSLGYSANVATQTGGGDIPKMDVGASITKGDFKFSPYYGKASELMMPKRPPPIRRPDGKPSRTEDGEYAFYADLWPDAAKTITAMLEADMPGFFGKQFERTAGEKGKREQQDQTFAAMAANNKIESDQALAICDRLKAIPGSTTYLLCGGKVAEIAANETMKFNVSKAGAFLQVTGPVKSASEANMTKAVASIKDEHDKVLKRYEEVYKQYKLDPQRIITLSGKDALKAGVGASVAGKLGDEDTAKRLQQGKSLEALAKDFDDDGKRALTACAKADPIKASACTGAVNKIADAEDKVLEAKTLALFGTPPADKKPAGASDVSVAVDQLKTQHAKVVADYKAVLASYQVAADWQSPVGAGKRGTFVAAVPAGPGGKIAVGSAIGGPVLPGTAAIAPPGPAINPGLVGQLAGGTPGRVGGVPPVGSLGTAGILEAGALPRAQVQPPAPQGRIGMPGLPTMGSLPPPLRQGVPPSVAPALVPPAPAAVMANSPAAAVGAVTAADLAKPAQVQRVPDQVMLPAPPVATPQSPAVLAGAMTGADLAKQAQVQRVPDQIPLPLPGAGTPMPVATLPPPAAGIAGALLPGRPALAVAGPSSVIPVPPFNPQNYRTDRTKALGDKWLPQCKPVGNCRETLTVLISRRVDTEIQSITGGNPDHANKVAVDAFLRQTDMKFDPQFLAEINKPAVVVVTPAAPSSMVPQAVPPVGPGMPKVFKGILK